ncbi:hypothetical protein V6259_10935 [Marinomonas sp. TI.3.20]|uniref:hypothetical protein n=1 Tax=Marinomonas sp. TI.3.20 TaxID=3121296 RepID=UPI00312008A1
MLVNNQPFWQSPTTQLIGFVAGWLLISIVTLTPMEQLPAVAGSDKLHHVLGFSGWSLLCVFGPRKRFFIMALFIFLWGGAIELIQPSVNRHGEWADFVADGIGVLLVTLAALIYSRFSQKTP